MFPIRDHNPSRNTPYVTWALIAVNVAVFAYSWRLHSDEAAITAFYRNWAFTPAFISDGSGYITFFTSMFMHGSLMHIIGNMLFLWIFGDNLEDQFGHVRFLIFYLASGVLAALAQYLGDTTTIVPMVGASGAIAGVMGAYLLLFPKARVDILIILIIIIRVVTLPAWVMLGFWFGIQMVSSITNFGSTEGGVAYLAHAGGFIAGILLALPWWLRAGGTEFWNQFQGAPPHPEAQTRWRRTTIPTVRRRRR